MALCAMEFNKKALNRAVENLELNFELVQHLIQAKDLKAALDVQTEFARRHAKSYVQQARELSSLVAQSMRHCFEATNICIF